MTRTKKNYANWKEEGRLKRNTERKLRGGESQGDEDR